MRYLARSWEGMTPRERIVAMSLVAVCYGVHQRALVKLAQIEAQARRVSSPPPQRPAVTDSVTDSVTNGVTMEEA